MYKVDKKHPQGSILLFTLVILTLAALLGMAIIVNTKTELTITTDNSVGQEAFNRADSTLTIALMLTRQLAKEFDPDEIKTILATNKDGKVYSVTPSARYFKKDQLPKMVEMITPSIRDRYLSATDVNNATGSSTKVIEPFITVTRLSKDSDGKMVEEIIGTAAVTMGNSIPTNSEGAGASIGESRGDTGDGSNIKMYYMVTADGRSSLFNKNDGNESNYYTGNPSSTHSVITAIFTDLAF